MSAKSIDVFNPSLGIQTVMDMPEVAGQHMPQARPLASNMLFQAGLEELYRPSNARSLVETALCPEVGDGEMLRPDVFSANLGGCLEKCEASGNPALVELAEKELRPLLENKMLLRAYVNLMMGG